MNLEELEKRIDKLARSRTPNGKSIERFISEILKEIVEETLNDS